MASYHLSVKTIKRSAGRSATAAAAYRSASVIACDREGRMHDYTAKRGVGACFILAPAVRRAKALFTEMRERLELARDAWAKAREEGQGRVGAGLAALRAAAGRQAKEEDQDEVRQRLARIAGRDLSEGYDHAPGQDSREIRGRLADVLGKATAEDQKREKAREKEREQEMDEERRRQRDRDLGWEL